MINLSVTHTERVASPVERVFAFTQDWSKRTLWDGGITRVQELPGQERAYRVRARFFIAYTARYTLFNPPSRTGLALTDCNAPWLIARGGGAWHYDPSPDGKGTLWTQTNVLTVPTYLALLAPWMRGALAGATRTSMMRARRLLEAAGGGVSAA